MNRQKIDSSVKIDNFIRNEPVLEQPMQASHKNSKPTQKIPSYNLSNIQNPPNLSSYSQMGKSKGANPSSYTNKQ